MENISKHNTLYEHFFKTRNILVDITLMIFAVFTLSIFSNARIEMWPVPITLQTFGVFLIAFFFGARKGVLTLSLYTLAGLVGFSVFSGHKSGLATLMGPTGGYIIGFFACIYFVGKMIENGHGRTKKSILKLMLIGNGLIYICGLIGLWFYLNSTGSASILKVLQLGMIPFLLGDFIKIIGAIALFPNLWKIEKKI